MNGSEQTPFEAFLKEHGFPLLITIVSILVPVLAYLTGFPAAFKDDPSRAVLLGVVLFLISEVLWLSWQTGSMKRATQGATQESKLSTQQIHRDVREMSSLLPNIEKSLAALKGFSDLDKLREMLQGRKDSIGRAGLETLNKLTTSMQPLQKNRGFVVRSESFALDAYEHYWKILLEEQLGRKKVEPNYHIIVRVTHSSTSHIWDSPNMAHAIRLQKNFIEAGGVIVRVFLNDKLTPPADTLRHMADMRKYKVHVFYIYSGKVTELESDFLWADPVLLEWISGQSRDKLSMCRISEPDDTERRERDKHWTAIGLAVLEGATDVPAPIRRILETFSDESSDCVWDLAPVP